MQTLYELDASQHAIEASLAARIDGWRVSDEAAAFARELVLGVLGDLGEIDGLIGSLAPSWPVDQLPSVERNVLRVAIFEIVSGTDTPPKVAVSEAVELAKSFGSENSPRFVNGVLGSVLARENVKV